jgi:hypothetical protein
MARYKDIQDYVRSKSGFVPKSCWIAEVLSEHGLTKSVAPNRKDGAQRLHPCPAQKRPEIENALKHFEMIK